MMEGRTSRESSEERAQAEAEAEAVYHERQRLQLCLLHALNNLFQDQHAFTRADLDAIARDLSSSSSSIEQQDLSSHSSRRWGWALPLPLIFQPHHNALTGNYDANVLLAALEAPAKRKRVLWHDRRTPPASLDLAAPALMGLLLNTKVARLHGICTSRHWLALRCIRGVWYNLDSDLPAPRPFPHPDHLLSFLDDALASGGEIFLIFNLD